MSESIWWTDEPWWERKVLPLGFITLSFRQLATLIAAFLVAFVVSPVRLPNSWIELRRQSRCLLWDFWGGIHHLEQKGEAHPGQASGGLFCAHGRDEGGRKRPGPASRPVPDRGEGRQT